jgi:signal transduction histidine kinase
VISVLVVDDEEPFRRLLKRELGRKGFAVEVAADGNAALALLRERAFDVILLDIVMPGLDGPSTMKRLRQDPAAPAIIVLTGRATVETAVEAMKNGAFDYLTKPYKLDELIKEVLLLLQHRTARLQHRIDLRLTRQLPKIQADAGSLRQVLMNLLLNAISFTPEGGSITIATEAATGPARPGGAGGGAIRITVRDTGVGIAPEIIGKIFDPFFTTRPVGEGTGLGLTISHRIVEEHGGSIDVESAPGAGAAFTITLPAAGGAP